MRKKYSFLPYESFNLNEIKSKYEKLNMLKEALGLDEDDEINEDLIFNLVSEHNYNEFYLLEYMINKIIYAPTEVRIQNFLLISLYDKPEEYREQYQAIKKAYETNYIFKKFASSIKKDLYLEDEYNRRLFNYQIYEICSEYITDKLILEPEDVYLNLHFMQKWIFEQRKLKLEPFTDVEKEIIHYLVSGYSVYELLKEDLIKGEKDKEFLTTIIHKILPAKCRVETINQVMATLCCHYPDPAKMETRLLRGIEELREMLENGELNDF